MNDLLKNLKKIIKTTKLSYRKMGVIVNVSSSTICNLINKKYHQIEQDSDYEKLKKWIYDIFIKENDCYGRKCIAQELFKKMDMLYVIDKLVELWIKLVYFVKLEKQGK